MVVNLNEVPEQIKKLAELEFPITKDDYSEYFDQSEGDIIEWYGEAFIKGYLTAQKELSKNE